MQLNRHRAPTGDRGFTLPEMLIAIVILGIIAVPLSNTLITLFRNMDSSTARMAASSSAQISATYFAQDVETVGKRDYTAPNAPLVGSVLLSGTAGATCGTGGTSALIRFLSDSHTASGSTAPLSSVVVSWALQTVGTDTQLVRTRCVEGAVVSTATVAHYVTGVPSVSCSSSCSAATVPRSATLSFTVTPPLADAYAVSLTGSRRQS